MTDTTAPTPSDARAALVRLVAVVAAAVLAAVLSGVTATVLVVFALIVMVMLHELGHFLTAKAAGMKVTEFFVGFGPKLWSVRRGETEYGVKAIPAGGYCKIVGMSNLEKVDPADEPRTYREKPYWRRLSVGVAGSAMHFLIAFVLLYATLSFVGVVRYDRELPRIGTISRLETGPSPAQRAGFRVGDRIVSYDGAPFTGWDGLRTHIRANPGRPVTFEVRRDGRVVTLTATPVDLAKARVAGAQGPVLPPGQSYGFVGIGPAFPVERAGPIEGLGRTVRGMGRATGETVKALGALFSPHGVSSYTKQLTGRDVKPAPDQPRFLSPVGFVRVAGQAAHSGLRDVLVLLFSINIFVGIFNMIPLLPLDGGHVAIATYERARSRGGRRYRVDVARLMPVTYAVFLVIVTIGLSSLYLDIVRPIANPFQ
jgi:membrane-associated protease RseP (regulator of RpoE activity)